MHEHTSGARHLQPKCESKYLVQLDGSIARSSGQAPYHSHIAGPSKPGALHGYPKRQQHTTAMTSKSPCSLAAPHDGLGFGDMMSEIPLQYSGNGWHERLHQRHPQSFGRFCINMRQPDGWVKHLAFFMTDRCQCCSTTQGLLTFLVPLLCRALQDLVVWSRAVQEESVAAALATVKLWALTTAGPVSWGSPCSMCICIMYTCICIYGA